MALIVITGGSRSGKSRAAQSLAEELAGRGDRVIVGVFGRASSDEEMERRVAAHRDARPATLATLEVTSTEGWIDTASDATLVVDCLGTALGLIMEECWPPSSPGALREADPDQLPEGYVEDVGARFSAMIDALLSRERDTIIVTNEVGSGLVSAWASGRLFADLLGKANAMLIAGSDCAYLAIGGRMLDLKELPDRIAWPVD